ncbi:hypothetical protein TREVI0001_2588 [Treponema vincentii ATCC 35580]|uniref:Uncharacterized protein n=1 Tax=Treponema vincentii ATCC 35580 TaxID=596324 RepID=C8PNF8_9SPIR|nr:hypothetical protein TREVI0001_2588 [Treponema vincentii ATCC 35580]
MSQKNYRNGHPCPCCRTGAFANSLLRSVLPCTLLNDEICA